MIQTHKDICLAYSISKVEDSLILAQEFKKEPNSYRLIKTNLDEVHIFSFDSNA